MRNAILLICTFANAFAQLDWNPQRAAEYLDNRQQKWSEWKTAAAPGGACISCHTGLTYLLARPQLRAKLHESQPTPFETQLVAGVYSRINSGEKMFVSFKKEPLFTQATSVEAIMSAASIAAHPSAKQPELTESDRKVFDRLISLQLQSGPNQGVWAWFSLNLEPWEASHSAFYGASLAAFAIGSTPASYRNKAEVTKAISQLKDYLDRQAPNQPLHNRTIALLAEARLKGVITKAAKLETQAALWKAQKSDGSWTLESLGPMKFGDQSPHHKGESSNYATAFVSYALQQSGADCTDPRLKQALTWLASRQESNTGAWTAWSMNKLYPEGSMESQFMTEAASGYAVLALLGNCANR